MKAGPRFLAVQFLREVFAASRRTDSLSRDPRFLRLHPRDRRLAVELVLGVSRWLRRLDHALSRFSNRPLERLDPDVLWVLRVAAYELEFLSVPARAAVHQAVGLCRAVGKSSAGAFVNAVLRQYLRVEPTPPRGDSAETLSILHSHPEWLARRYVDRWGPGRAEALMARNNERPRPPLWVNPFRVDFGVFQGWLRAEGIPFRVRPELPCCLDAPRRLARHRWHREGFCFFMDAASQQTVAGIDLESCRLAGDFCAAPGGKAFLLASRLPADAWLCAADSNGRRLRRLKERAARCQVPLRLVQADLTRPAPLRTAFDFILLDAPCSGLGTLGANPEIRWRAVEEDLKRHQRRQVSILRNGFGSLRRGGRLLYSTCSTEPEENEEAVELFLRAEPSAKLLEPPRRNFPEGVGQCFFSALVGHQD